MNPHPGEAPPPFARRTTTNGSPRGKRQAGKGAERWRVGYAQGRRERSARAEKEVAGCRQLGGPLSVLIAPYITHAVFLITYFCPVAAGARSDASNIFGRPTARI